MSEENDMKLEYEEDSGYETSPEKAEKDEYRNFQEEPGDDDGENRHPTEHNSMLYTALIVVKGMIGAGILNLPLIIKTFGIIGGSILTFTLSIIAITVAYYLGKCKDITQRYSYAIYSKLMLGVAGTIIMKISLIVMLSTLAVVQLLVFGDVLKGLSLLFWDINTKILVVGIALVLLPFMFQKDISGITRYAYFGIIGLGTYYICHVILFIHKWNQNKIIFEKSMLYPNGTFKEIILCVGGYYNAFAFHMSYFTIYLPLKPRNNKTMMKSVTIGTLTTSFIYLSYGILFYLMYGTQISDSALKYLQSDLFEAHKNGETFIVIIFVICFLSFLINASISSMIHFYLFKSHLIGLIRFLIKKKLEKEKEAEEKKAVQMVEIEDNKEGKENNIENRKFSDDVHSIKEKEELLSERKQFLITLGCYCYALTMAIGFNKIIVLDSFNGSTVANYINIIAPCMFYLYFARDKKNYGEKALASFDAAFGTCLVVCYFVLLFF